MDTLNVAPTIALPTQHGSHGIALPAGQTIQAVVLALLENNVARIQLPQAIFDIQSSVPLTQGAHLTLALQGTGAQAKLVILASDIPGQAAQPGHPIGEATILGRVLPSAMRAAAPAVPVADAPSITPAPDPVPQALAQAMRTAATRQGGLAPLFANLAQLVRADAKLPEPVRAAAAQLLATQVPLDGTLNAGAIKQAAARSGLFLEAHLAATSAPMGAASTSGAAPTTSAAPTGAAPTTAAQLSAPAVQGDLKAALLVLRQVLKTWSDATAPAGAPTAAPTPGAVAPDIAAQSAKTIGLALASLRESVELAPKTAAPGTPAGFATPPTASTPATPAPPPYRGAPTAAQAPVLPSMPAELPPHEKAERLIAQTDAALARHTLLQSASLPDRVDDARADPAAQRMTFEIPFATPQGTAMAQFEISRDGHRGPAEGQGPVWRARFSLDVEPMGPVHALVTIVGTRTSVTLWAEREASAARLADASAQLAQSLKQAELEPGEIQCRLGAPQRPRPAAGQFLDRAS